MEQSSMMWIVFITVVVVLLVLDLGVLHRKAKEISVKESLILSAFYIAVSVVFGGWIWLQLGSEKAGEYFTGYLVEKSLSMDNLFIMSMIFGYFAIPRQYQHRVLFWGILGVIVLRGIMIGVGAAVVSRFEWVLLVFAVFLVVTGIKMLLSGDNEEKDIANNPLLKFLKKHLHITEHLHEEKFRVKLADPKNPGKTIYHFTPLFLALLLIEGADVIFAVDSIPAIFAITTDPYIVYTSNIFAVLGLRSLYFALSACIDRFHYLKYALALILVFIGGKVLAAEALHIEKVPASFSLGVTIGLLASGIAISLAKTRKK